MQDLNTYIQEQLEKSQDAGFTCVEAEENILRRMILRQGVAEESAMDLLPQDFSDPEYAKVYRAIQSLVAKQRQIDLVSLDAEMTVLYGDGWRSDVLIDLTRQRDYTVAKWQDIKDHIQIVKALSTRRQAIANLEVLVDSLRDPRKDIGETLAEIQDAADKVVTDEAEWVSMSDVLLKTFEYVEKRQKGEIKSITTGLGGLDSLIGGFFAEEMTIIAARPSVGKSAFGANIALAAARAGFKVGIVSCEMSAEGLGQRLLSHGSFVDGMKLRRADLDDEAWGRVADAMAEMSELPIEFLFDCSAVEDVVKTARRKARKGELDILIVDYLQFMETRRNFREERLRIGYISHNLKRLARRAHIPVIALAQVTRQGEGAMPTMKMLRESGDIEQDADGIIFLHRPDNPDDPSVYPPDRQGLKLWKDKGLTYLCIGIAKQRNGSIGQTCCLFDASLMHYIEIMREDKK